MKLYTSFINELKIVSEPKDAWVKKAQIKGSKDVSDYVRELWPVDIAHREACVGLYLNRMNNTIGYAVLGIGGVTWSGIDPKIVFQNALLCNATSVILTHNHPSGNLKASDSDIAITKKITDAGKMLDIDLLDHVIITEEGYYSLVDEGHI